MTTETPVRKKPLADGPRTARKAVVDVGPRVRGVIKVIFKTLRNSTALPELQEAVKKQGYSIAEFDAAWQQCLDDTAVDVGSAAQMVATPSKVSSSASESRGKIFDPYAAGERLVNELQVAEGGAWTGQELQKQFALTSAVLYRRRKEHRILSWRDARHEFHYPKWQFTPTGALLPGVQELLQTFRSDDEWRVVSYFLRQRRQLGGRRPLDLLRAGEREKVLAHAKIHVEENTW